MLRCHCLRSPPYIRSSQKRRYQLLVDLVVLDDQDAARFTAPASNPPSNAGAYSSVAVYGRVTVNVLPSSGVL